MPRHTSSLYLRSSLRRGLVRRDHGAMALYLSTESERGQGRHASVGARGTPDGTGAGTRGPGSCGPDQISQGHVQSYSHVNCATPNISGTKSNQIKSKDTLKKIHFKVALIHLVLFSCIPPSSECKQNYNWKIVLFTKVKFRSCFLISISPCPAIFLNM